MTKLRLCRRVLAASLVVAGMSLPNEARAEGPRVLFVVHEASAFSARMRAEIEAMGFTVENADTLPEDGPKTAVAAARIVEEPPPRRVELWIVDTTRGRLALRAVIQPSADDDEAIQSVRASEQLRAFFQPLRTPAPPFLAPPPSPSPPLRRPVPEAAPLPPVAKPPAIEPSRRFVASAAFAVPLQPGGAGIDFAVRARWMATRVLGVGAMVAIPIAGSTLTSKEGSASVSAALFGAEVSAVFFEMRPLRLVGSAGFGLAWLHARGSANSPYVGQGDSTITGLPMLGLEVAPGLADGLRLHAGAHAAVAVPRADIAFAGRTVATWARPLGLLSCGVSVDF